MASFSWGAERRFFLFFLSRVLNSAHHTHGTSANMMLSSWNALAEGTCCCDSQRSKSRKDHRQRLLADSAPTHRRGISLRPQGSSRRVAASSVAPAQQVADSDPQDQPFFPLRVFEDKKENSPSRCIPASPRYSTISSPSSPLHSSSSVKCVVCKHNPADVVSTPSLCTFPFARWPLVFLRHCVA